MNTMPINSVNPSFDGTYQMKGSWTPKMKKIVKPVLEDLAKSDNKIIAKMSTKYAIFDKYHSFGEKLYKLKISVEPEKQSWLKIIMGKIGLLDHPSFDVTEHFHRSKSLENILSIRMDKKRFALQLGIKK